MNEWCADRCKTRKIWNDWSDCACLHPNTEELTGRHTCPTICHAHKPRRLPLPDPHCNHQQQQTPSFQPHWRAPLSLFCLICFGHCGQIVVITETLEANKKPSYNTSETTQHTKMFKTQELTVKLHPLVYNCLFYRCAKWLQTNISSVSTRCCVEPN